MKCHLQIILFMSWLCTEYLLVTALYSVSTDCGNFPTNASQKQIIDGSNIFKIKIEHFILNPNLDILPNVSYTVTIQQNLTFSLRGFSMEIIEKDSTSLPITELYSEITDVDEDTVQLLSRNTSELDLICTVHKKGSMIWTPRVFRRCFDLRAVIYSNDSTFYEISRNICRSQGNRSYHAAEMRGYIRSHGFPLIYPDNYNITFIIFSLKKSSIHLQFQFFNLEPAYQGKCLDAVTVTSKKTDVLCGAILDENLEQLHFQSDTGILTVVFSTDNKIGQSGFKAVYYIYDINECNRRITLEGDTITSVGYPDAYFPHMSCTVHIKFQPEYRIQLTLKDIDIEMNSNGVCSKDYLQIVFGDVEYFLCGNMSTFQDKNNIFQSSSSEAVVIFYSDFQHEGRGFLIEYFSFIPCLNQTFTNATGAISSDNYPHSYSNNQDCFYTIHVNDKDVSLELIFEHFHTESTGNVFLKGKLCNLDFVEINFGDKTERICGQWKGDQNSLMFRSYTDTITIRFVSNNNITRSGFYAFWRTTFRNISSLQCASSWIEKDETWFEVVRSPLTWDESNIDCQQKGGILATIMDFETQILLEGLLSKSYNCSLKLDAFWIGANDILAENDFRWVNGNPLEFAYWFPGSVQNDYASKQPSDDGWSGEDCVEVRQTFFTAQKGVSNVSHYFWNDRQCSNKNPYICQFSKDGDTQTTIMSPIVRNYVYHLNMTYHEVNITSPGFPDVYPMLSDIYITVTVPDRTNVAVTFHYFDLEFSEICEYDNLTLSSKLNDKTICGEWNSKLKKLEWISNTNVAIIRFRTDASVSKSGFYLTASIFTYTFCNVHGNEALYINSSACLYPFLEDRVTQQQADQLCTSQNTELIANISDIESSLLINYIFVKNDVAKNINNSLLVWSKNRTENGKTCQVFVIKSNSSIRDDFFTSGTEVSCADRAAFICKFIRSDNQVHKANILCDSFSGVISMLKDENETYANNSIIEYTFKAPKHHRIVVGVLFLDIEFQKDCLFDFLTFNGFKNITILCGSLPTESSIYFTSQSNFASIVFKSDESILGRGFKFNWMFIDTARCFDIQSFGNSGWIKSWNFRNPFTDSLFCCSEINTVNGSRIIVDVEYSKFTDEASCIYIMYSANGEKQFCANESTMLSHSLSTVISSSNVISFCIHAQKLFLNDGFSAKYTVDLNETPNIKQIMKLNASSEGELTSPNFPDVAPMNYLHTTRLIAPVGYNIQLSVSYVVPYINDNCTATYFQVLDDTLGENNLISILKAPCSSLADESIVVRSYLNNLKIIFSVGGEEMFTQEAMFNATFSVKSDIDYLSKTRNISNIPFSDCSNESCYNEGQCMNVSYEEFKCSCPVHFTGMFCQVSWCQLPVCLYGTCVLDQNGYFCICRDGYWGTNCNMTSQQCAANLCSGNGVCIADAVSGKLCSCNKDWEGTNCNIYKVFNTYAQYSHTLLDEPIWIGIIVVLMLLVLFGGLFLIRQRCSKYVKCCEDTDAVLKKQAEEAIPAHKNYIPSLLGTPTTAESPSLPTGFEAGDSQFLTVLNTYTPEIHTPPVNGENVEAAARLFEAYNNKSERRHLDKPSILSFGNTSVSGMVDGKLHFLQNDTDIFSSDNETVKTNDRFAHSEIRKSFSSITISQKENTPTFKKSNSVHADFNHRPHYYPNIVILNSSSNENLRSAKSIDDDNLFLETQERRPSIQRQKTLDEFEAQKKRKVFALRSKTTSAQLELPHFESRLAIRRACSNQDTHHRQPSPSPAPASFESDPTYWPNRRRFRMLSGAESSSDEMSDRYIIRSYCSQPDHLDVLNECKCCGKNNDIDFRSNRKSTMSRMSHRRSRNQHLKSVASERSSSFESGGKRKKRRYKVSGVHDLGHNKKHKYPNRHSDEVALHQRESDAVKKVCLHIMKQDIGEHEIIKIPVRKSRSNDLNLNKAANYALDTPIEESSFRKRSHSFHSQTIDSRRSQHPDDLLNEDQKSGSFHHEHTENEEEICTSLVNSKSSPDPINVYASSVLSVTDTDTGFSSSSPWREGAENNIKDRFKTTAIKDSAYQTKQSSMDRNPFECPKNSYENPEDGVTEQIFPTSFIKDKDGFRAFERVRNDMTLKLQQAAKRLIMYEKNSQFSKDSAFTNTFSEADDTGSCDSDTSSRDTHAPVRPKSGSYNFLQTKLFPLEQVSEECDTNNLDSTVMSTDLNFQYKFSEDIEMKEFNA